MKRPSNCLLTPTERRVLAHVGAARLDKQIAHDLGITEGNVRQHTNAIRRKFGFSRKMQLVLFANGIDEAEALEKARRLGAEASA